MIQFQFDHNAPHQLIAIDAVIKVFEGQSSTSGVLESSLGELGSLKYSEMGISNHLILSPQQLLTNIQGVQKLNGLPESTRLIPHNDSSPDDQTLPQARNESEGVDLNLSIEMETGTGKTYTYIRTIYQLHQTYGFCKFVIVVPSVAIREGTLKNLDITKKDMKAQFGVSANYTVWDSNNRNSVHNFAFSDVLQILVINIDSFASDSNIMNTAREKSVKPIDFLQAVRPIVIVDEPQNMETPKRRAAIHRLNPLCTLRYSATHRNPYNLIYRLTPVDAYNRGLVKQIQVDGITAEHNYNAVFMKLKEIQSGKKVLKAKLAFFVDTKGGGVTEKEMWLEVGDDVFIKSNGREIYREGFILASIEADEDKVMFSNGLVFRLGEMQGGFTGEIQKFQIERTVRWHFKRVQKLQSQGIKVLSLFFIDKVANYRSNTPDTKAKFVQWFEEAFEKANQEFPNLLPYTAESVHRGYFSQDKRGGSLKDTKGDTKDDEDTYNLIMKDKEVLLDLSTPVQFIFSHSALREGWDNPNVFQICTLNESTSQLRKRQEVGRGLRLPVNDQGIRITDPQVNLLTVIANESYEAFTRTLQTETEEDTGEKFTGKIIDANRSKVTVKLTKKELTRENYPLLFELWDKVSYHTWYQVSFKDQQLIDKAVEFFQDTQYYPTIRALVMSSNVGKISMSNTQGLTADKIFSAQHSMEAIEHPIPNVYEFIQNRVRVTRSVILEFFKKCGRVNEIFVDPQRFLECVVDVFDRAINDVLKNGGIKYERGEAQDFSYTQKLFTDELGEVLQDLVLDVNQGAEDKTLFNYYRVDSEIERDFARDCEVSEEVKFFFKIPRGFTIPTPLGSYSPDWAVVLERDEKLYFVAETKGTRNPEELRGVEQFKIAIGKKFFECLETGVRYKLVVKASDLINET